MEEVHSKHPNYLGVFIVLGILTAIEIGIAKVLPESTRIPVLLLLAAAKGMLVALYYMHLRNDSRLFAFFFGAGVFVLAIPLTIVILLESLPH